MASLRTGVITAGSCVLGSPLGPYPDLAAQEAPPRPAGLSRSRPSDRVTVDATTTAASTSAQSSRSPRSRSLSLDPPQLTSRYQDLMRRIERTCAGGPAPSGSSVVSACQHAASIVNDAAGMNVVEWDAENDVFDITDPYFLFYLRWSDTSD